MYRFILQLQNIWSLFTECSLIVHWRQQARLWQEMGVLEKKRIITFIKESKGQGPGNKVEVRAE